MATQPLSTQAAEGNSRENSLEPIPANAEQEQSDINQWRFEMIDALDREFGPFHSEARRIMEQCHQELRNLTIPLYKEVLSELTGVHGNVSTGLHCDHIINGLHNSSYRALEQVKNGLDEMRFALYQAKAYCLVLSEAQKRTGGTA